ncbi:MAG: hypothetical protein ACHP6I_02110 [Rickettsiales bacterium]
MSVGINPYYKNYLNISKYENLKTAGEKLYLANPSYDKAGIVIHSFADSIHSKDFIVTQVIEGSCLNTTAVYKSAYVNVATYCPPCKDYSFAVLFGLPVLASVAMMLNQPKLAHVMMTADFAVLAGYFSYCDCDKIYEPSLVCVPSEILPELASY